jgi:rRNA maturation endonuclease Nob1
MNMDGLVIGVLLAVILVPILMMFQKKCPHCDSRIPLGSHPRVCAKCGRDIVAK